MSARADAWHAAAEVMNKITPAEKNPPTPPNRQTAVSREAAIVAITDVTGKIEQVNDNFVRISKYSREELIGQDHRLLNSGLHHAEFIRDLWVTIANGRVWRNELRNALKTVHSYWVDTTIRTSAASMAK